jgi:hypothetical protein
VITSVAFQDSKYVMALITVEMEVMKIITHFVERELNLAIQTLNTLAPIRNALKELKFVISQVNF